MIFSIRNIDILHLCENKWLLSNRNIAENAAITWLKLFRKSNLYNNKFTLMKCVDFGSRKHLHWRTPF